MASIKEALINYLNRTAKDEISTKNFIYYKQNILRKQLDIQDWITAQNNARNVSMPSRYKLYGIYDNILIDEDVKTAMSKRIRFINSLKLVYIVGKKAHKQTTQWLQSPVWRDFKSDLLDTIYFGHSLFDLDFSNESKFYALVDRMHVNPMYSQLLKYPWDINGLNYKPLIEAGLITEAGKRDDLGLLNSVVPHATWKRNGYGDWAQYQQRAGEPYDILEYEDTQKQDKTDISTVFGERGGGNVVTVPQGFNHKVVNTAGGANNDLFDTFTRRMSNNILKIMLGQSGTTNDDTAGSYAKLKASLETEYDVNIDDAKFILDFLNYTFIDFVGKWGYPSGGTFEFIQEEVRTVSEQAEQDKKIAEVIKSGVFTPQYIKEHYGIDIEDKSKGLDGTDD